MMRPSVPPPDLWQQLPPLRQQEVLQTLVTLLLAHLESQPSAAEAPPSPTPKEETNS